MSIEIENENDLTESVNKAPIRLIKMEIVAYDKNENNLVDMWNKQCKETNQELYNIDMLEIDFKGKYVDFTDTRYRTDEEFKNKSILAPIRIPFDELDFINITMIKKEKEKKLEKIRKILTEVLVIKDFRRAEPHILELLQEDLVKCLKIIMEK